MITISIIAMIIIIIIAATAGIFTAALLSAGKIADLEKERLYWKRASEILSGIVSKLEQQIKQTNE